MTQIRSDLNKESWNLEVGKKEVVRLMKQENENIFTLRRAQTKFNKVVVLTVLCHSHLIQSLLILY